MGNKKIGDKKIVPETDSRQRGKHRGAMWTEFALQLVEEKNFRNDARSMTIRGELRKPPDKHSLRYSIGRVDPTSVTGIGRHGFFEDLPHVIEVLINLYEKGVPLFIEQEKQRMKDVVSRMTARAEESTQFHPADWRSKLQEIQKEMESIIE